MSKLLQTYYLFTFVVKGGTSDGKFWKSFKYGPEKWGQPNAGDGLDQLGHYRSRRGEDTIYKTNGVYFILLIFPDEHVTFTRTTFLIHYFYLYPTLQVFQYLSCKDVEVKAHIESALIAIFRFNEQEKAAVKDRKQEESTDALSTITNFLGSLTN